jgi:PII-like signaling protein
MTKSKPVLEVLVEKFEKITEKKAELDKQESTIREKILNMLEELHMYGNTSLSKTVVTYYKGPKYVLKDITKLPKELIVVKEVIDQLKLANFVKDNPDKAKVFIVEEKKFNEKGLEDYLLENEVPEGLEQIESVYKRFTSKK